MLAILRLLILGLLLLWLSSSDFRGHVLELELVRELEVQLNCGTLEFALESVRDSDIDLWAVDRTREYRPAGSGAHG
jgi:hypothetical protein